MYSQYHGTLKRGLIEDRPSLNHPAKSFLVPVLRCRICTTWPIEDEAINAGKAARWHFGTRKGCATLHRRAVKFVQLS